MKLINILILASGLVLSATASAGFLIEPYLGTYNLKSEISITGSPDSDDDLSSKSLMGARLGYGMLGLHAGLEYTIFKTDDEDMTGTGIFVKYEFPIMFQVFATYYTAIKADGLKDGTGTKVGIGYTGLPFVSINLEMIASKFDELETPIDGVTFESVSTGTAVTLSLPFDL